jgi:2-phosphoglycerate kinase
MMSWYKTEQIKDNEDLKVSKNDFVQEIKKFDRQQIKNTEVIEKKYSLWQRILKVLGMN